MRNALKWSQPLNACLASTFQWHQLDRKKRSSARNAA